MQAFVIAVLIKVFQSKPVQDKLAEWKTDILAFIRAEFTSWLPTFLKAIAVGMVQSAGQVVVNTEDRITDIIPGPIDDAVIDPMVERGLDVLGGLIGIKLR